VYAAATERDNGRMGLGEQRLERLLEVGRSLVGDLDLELVLKRVLEAARELTGARYAALGILDSRREELEQFLTVGIDEPTRRELGDLPRGHGVLGVLIRDPRPLRLRSVGDHPQSYGFPHGHPSMGSFLGVPVRIGGDVFGNLYLTEKQGAEEFDEADEQTLVALADWAAIAIGNARRHGGVRGQRDELARAVQLFETAEAIGGALAGETQLERVLELVVKRSRALVEARVMVLALREGDELVIRAASGEVERSQLGLAIPLQESLSGHVLSTGRAQRLSDSAPAVRAVLLSVFGGHTELAVPLQFRGRGLGVLAALDRLRDGPEFSAQDERLMTAFATSAATAVATARDVAAQGLRRSLEAAERERTRWARELHDQTLQDLAGLKVMLAGARRATEREQVDRIIEQAIEHVQLSIDALRGLVTELRPAALDELGTAPALRALIDRTAATSGLEIELSVDLAYEQGRADTRHAPELESTIYRLVQEALSNVVKHAGASRVTVAVIEHDTTVELHVRDDGAGIQTDATSEGFGLIGMRERITLLGGDLEVNSQPGAGITVAARIPVQRRPAQHSSMTLEAPAARPPGLTLRPYGAAGGRELSGPAPRS
jgi:signal transduction histidine kinase